MFSFFGCCQIDWVFVIQYFWMRPIAACFLVASAVQVVLHSLSFFCGEVICFFGFILIGNHVLIFYFVLYQKSFILNVCQERLQVHQDLYLLIDSYEFLSFVEYFIVNKNLWEQKNKLCLLISISVSQSKCHNSIFKGVSCYR